MVIMGNTFVEEYDFGVVSSIKVFVLRFVKLGEIDQNLK